MRTSRAWAALLFALLLAATAMAPVARATQSDRWIEQREDDPFAFGDPDTPPNSPQTVRKDPDLVVLLGRLRLGMFGAILLPSLSPTSVASPPTPRRSEEEFGR
jgi:hypothetical protein